MEILNQALTKYKDKHKGETATVIGSGHSLRQYRITDEEKENHIFIAVNQQGYYSPATPQYFFKIQPHYWFFGDPVPLPEGLHFEKNNPVDKIWCVPEDMPYEFNKRWFNDDRQRLSVPFFKNVTPKIEKFGHIMHLGLTNIQKTGAIPFNTQSIINPETGGASNRCFETEIDHHPMVHGSIIFPAMQFALFAGFKEIFVVGCDANRGYEYVKPTWDAFRIFVKKNYPKIRIVFINPVTDLGFEREYRSII